MRLVAYRRGDAVRHGALDGEGIIEWGEGDVGAAIHRGLIAPSDGVRIGLSDVEILAPLLRPGKLLAAAANYQAHVVESRMAPLERSRLSPRLFLMPPTAIVGPNAQVQLPSVSSQIDWEAELAVVIGTRVKDIPVDNALQAVAGYLPANDLSARSLDFGYERDTEGVAGFFDWLEGKWLDGFCPLGPSMVTADEVADPQDLSISLTLNGEKRQDGSTKDMIFSVAELIAFASRLMTLEPGDVVLTGTPAGVGQSTGTYLAAGDEVTVQIADWDALTTRIVG